MICWLTFHKRWLLKLTIFDNSGKRQNDNIVNFICKMSAIFGISTIENPYSRVIEAPCQNFQISNQKSVYKIENGEKFQNL